LYRGSIIGRKILMTGQCRTVSRSVEPEFQAARETDPKSESPSLSPTRRRPWLIVRPTDGRVKRARDLSSVRFGSVFRVCVVNSTSFGPRGARRGRWSALARPAHPTPTTG
jgi:hypothetical protein